MRQIALHTGWSLKQDAPADDRWLPAPVPGCVHEALIAAGAIPDPFYGLNELAVQWVGEADWLYRCTFDLGAEDLAAGPAALCLDGLDTFATVWLNGAQILASDNMFVPQRVPVDGLLRAGANELRIRFESALRRGRELEARYGWDWGPCLITAGPWLPVRLEFGHARIADLHAPAEVAPDLDHVHLPVVVQVAAATPGSLSVQLTVSDPTGALIGEALVPVVGDGATASFRVESPQLWWPAGYGAQPRYRVQAALLRDGELCDTRELAIGLRRLRLVQEPVADEPGRSFYFEVNNTPIFCSGANWIPADSFTTRITPQRYRELLEAAVAAHMPMLRVWGGGIYEHAPFYELCDELGFLVWQDFMFGCGVYPAHPEFVASVRAEAEAQLRRLRNHPCLALWCGNNEDYQIANAVGAYDPTFEGDFTTTNFPARLIYERLLPELCAALDPGRPYWPGSPFGGQNGNDPTYGDRHTWDVWHGGMAPYGDYISYAGRFVSEFGMQAAPHRRTVEGFAPPEERRPHSRTFEFHNKAPDGPRRLAVYLSDTVGAAEGLDDYIYGTQLVQAEALGAAYRDYRRRWGGPGRRAVGGALVWQLDDCWPVTSWAIIDHFGRPKAGYYRVRRELAPLAVGLRRGPDGVEAWVANRGAAVAATLVVAAYDLGGALLVTSEATAAIAANGVTELGLFDMPAGAAVGARLVVGGAVVHRAALWPEPLKHYALPDPELRVEVAGDLIRLSCARPAKGVWIEAGDAAGLSDNMLDLLPGDAQEVRAGGVIGETVRVRGFGGWRVAADL